MDNRGVGEKCTLLWRRVGVEDRLKRAPRRLRVEEGLIVVVKTVEVHSRQDVDGATSSEGGGESKGGLGGGCRKVE